MPALKCFTKLANQTPLALTSNTAATDECASAQLGVEESKHQLIERHLPMSSPKAEHENGCQVCVNPSFFFRGEVYCSSHLGFVMVSVGTALTIYHCCCRLLALTLHRPTDSPKPKYPRHGHGQSGPNGQSRYCNLKIVLAVRLYDMHSVSRLVNDQSKQKFKYIALAKVAA